jgi:hypothetical protein
MRYFGQTLSNTKVQIASHHKPGEMPPARPQQPPKSTAAVVPVKSTAPTKALGHGTAASGVLPSATSNTQTAAANAKKPPPMLVGRVARKAAPSADGVMPPSDDDEHGHDGGDEAR